MSERILIIGIYTNDFENEYISLTDIAKYRNDNDPRFVIQNWMRNRNTVEFLAVWEELHNPDFNRVQFEAVRSEAGLNRFVMTPTKWIEQTNAIGIVSKAGRYGGGTYAHSDIAMAFATWISPEFQLYIMKDYRRLKQDENSRLSLDWNLNRALSKVNYRIHTDAVKENLIPPELTPEQIVYEVSYVLVFKLSRFGRNAADVLATLQVMQDFGVNLICVEDGIDSSKDAGKLMISVLSAVAEIERENIRVQTMEGRMQKAREGKWNGGFAPYGYSLIDGKLEVNEEEAVAIRTIFNQYVNTDLGANGIAKYLENHGIHKIARQNGTNPLFDAALIRRIIQNPVYCGKISYGRRRTEKVHGTRNEYRQVRKEDYLLVDGLHEALVSEEVWEEREFLSQLVDNVQIYEERKENGQWLKSIEFKLPIIEKEFTLSLDNNAQNETVCLLSKKCPV